LTKLLSAQVSFPNVWQKVNSVNSLQWKKSEQVFSSNTLDKWVIGHCFLARHESIVNNQDPTCNKCFLDEQTPWHLLMECPATLSIRKEIPPVKWTTGNILKAIKNGLLRSTTWTNPNTSTHFNTVKEFSLLGQFA